jgi:hypothetical protein
LGADFDTVLDIIQRLHGGGINARSALYISRKGFRASVKTSAD